MVIAETVYEMPFFMTAVSLVKRDDANVGLEGEWRGKHTVSRPKLMEPTNLRMETVVRGILMKNRVVLVVVCEMTRCSFYGVIR